MNKDKLYGEAMKKWGMSFQTTMLMEECAELIQACSKHQRGKDRAIFNLAEEIADVTIMIEQIKRVLDIDGLVNDYKEKKLIRLYRLVNE